MRRPTSTGLQREWRDECRHLHRKHGPAIEGIYGLKCWYLYGQRVFRVYSKFYKDAIEMVEEMPEDQL
jgi:hypothetical protein